MDRVTGEVYQVSQHLLPDAAHGPRGLHGDGSARLDSLVRPRGYTVGAVRRKIELLENLWRADSYAVSAVHRCLFARGHHLHRQVRPTPMKLRPPGLQ
jgi:hypothetical protein